MIKNIRKKSQEDKGESVLTAIIVLPLMFFTIMTGVDMSIMMANKATIETMADNAARTIAIVGGNGNASQATPLEKRYAFMHDCSSDYPAGVSATSTAIECQLGKSLIDANLVALEVLPQAPDNRNGIACTPEKTTFIGQDVTCTVAWEYKGLPGSGLSFMQFTNAMKTEGHARSEVNLSNVNLVSR
jgi:Flp pilus assembly protein TadG